MRALHIISPTDHLGNRFPSLRAVQVSTARLRASSSILVHSLGAVRPFFCTVGRRLVSACFNLFHLCKHCIWVLPGILLATAFHRFPPNLCTYFFNSRSSLGCQNHTLETVFMEADTLACCAGGASVRLLGVNVCLGMLPFPVPLANWMTPRISLPAPSPLWIDERTASAKLTRLSISMHAQLVHQHKNHSLAEDCPHPFHRRPTDQPCNIKRTTTSLRELSLHTMCSAVVSIVVSPISFLTLASRLGRSHHRKNTSTRQSTRTPYSMHMPPAPSDVII